MKRLEVWYDEDESCRLRWVEVCFYSALGIGVRAPASLFRGHIPYGLPVVVYTTYLCPHGALFYNHMTETDAKFLIPALSTKSVPAGDAELTAPIQRFRRNIRSRKCR